jgi:hypothetical protein
MEDNTNSVKVARPSKWGNPFKVVTDGYGYAVRPPGHATIDPRNHRHTRREANALAVQLYQAWSPSIAQDARAELAGKDLACWCPLDQPCHADVLLEIANGGAA